jgi:hypothetical protein
MGNPEQSEEDRVDCLAKVVPEGASEAAAATAVRTTVEAAVDKVSVYTRSLTSHGRRCHCVYVPHTHTHRLGLGSRYPAYDNVAMVTLAPEIPGAPDAIRYVHACATPRKCR